MAYGSFSVFSEERYLDLRLYQSGWEQCAPAHSFGPHVRDHFLFHYIISGKGFLERLSEDGSDRQFFLRENQGFLIYPGQENTYAADRKHPWKYVWLEFDGLQAAQRLGKAGLDDAHPIYRPQNRLQGERIQNEMLYIANHPAASALHLTGHLWLFLDALIYPR